MLLFSFLEPLGQHLGQFSGKLLFVALALASKAGGGGGGGGVHERNILPGAVFFLGGAWHLFRGAGGGFQGKGHQWATTIFFGRCLILGILCLRLFSGFRAVFVNGSRLALAGFSLRGPGPL